jgi:serine acetyltransferase
VTTPGTGPAAAVAPARGRWRRFRDDVRADYAMIQRYEDRYGHASATSGHPLRDSVQKVGFQMMIWIRWMRLLRDLRIPLACKVTSRLIRHLYGSDVHWDAEFAPGVVLVHGMGLAISHAARVGPGCILFQNVCLGLSVDPVTREVGAPCLEADVHLMPGTTLIGPITVGEGSKVMAGVVLTASVPPRSIVEAVVPQVRSRAPKPAPRAAGAGDTPEGA